MKLLVTVLALLIPFTGTALIPTNNDGKPLTTIAPMLKKTNPAIVNIATSAYVENSLMNDPFFRYFYGVPQKKEVSSLGSGVIVDAKAGLIITNFHVIKDADTISVSLQNGENYTAEVIGMDQDTDLAVIKINAKNLIALRWADSEKLEVGDFVVAIGNPYGLAHSVTSGIISALGRQGLGIEQYEDFIQTDAAINPGNSGGALVNLNGELVGINTAIVGPSGGNVGIGFAIPSMVARNIMQQLVKFGEVRRGLFGVFVNAVTPEIAKSFQLSNNYGVIVTGVEAKSSAEKAGIRAYDVITKINGRQIRNESELDNRLGLIPLGSKLALEVWRDNKKLTLNATLTEIPITKIDGEKLHPYLKNVVLAETLDAEKSTKGVRVESIDRNSRAAYWGLKKDDIIVGVGRYRARTVDEFKDLLANSRKNLYLTIERQSRSYLVTIK